jgi:probable HAF family extracellular repeat protein
MVLGMDWKGLRSPDMRTRTALQRTFSTLATLTFTVALPTLGVAQTLPIYHVTELTPPAGAACAATTLNDAGVVAGSCVPSSASVQTYGATVWRGGVATVIGVLPGGHYASPTAINSLGTVVGDADTSSPRPQAFVQTANGLLNIDPNNGGNSRSIGIMDNGVIFGNMTKSLSGNTSSWNVVMWTQDPGHPDRYKENFLPKLQGGDQKTVGVFAWQSNKVGQVVGWVTNSVIGQLGGFWNNDAAHSVVALQALPGGNHSLAWALNDLGQAVGESNTPEGATRAVLWQNDAAHTAIDLGTLPGDTTSSANGVNSLGQVVGMSASGAFPTLTGIRSFLWQNGTMQELATLVDPADGFWTVDSVSGINNAGQILAFGTSNGRSAYILLTPVVQ